MVEVDYRNRLESKPLMDFGIHSLIPLYVIELDELRKRSLAIAISNGGHDAGHAVAGPAPVRPKSNHSNCVAGGEDVPEGRISKLCDLCLTSISLAGSPGRLSQMAADCG